MNSYTIPADMNEKEKIIGGILNMHEFLWVLTGFLLGLGTFGLLFPIIGKASLFIGLLITPAGIPFVVIKKEGLTLFEYKKRSLEFKRKVKILPNITH